MYEASSFYNIMSIYSTKALVMNLTRIVSHTTILVISCGNNRSFEEIVFDCLWCEIYESQRCNCKFRLYLSTACRELLDGPESYLIHIARPGGKAAK